MRKHKSIKTRAIVLHKRAMGEKHFSVTLFTPTHGKIQAIAKGAREMKSKFTGHLDLLNICDIEIYEGPKNNIITECTLRNAFTSFRDDLDKFYISEDVAKMIKLFTTEYEESEDLYMLLTKTFIALAKYKESKLILQAFKVKLIGLLGNMPDLYHLNDTPFDHFSLNQKKILKFLLTNEYEEIRKLKLNKKYENSLEKMTNELFVCLT